MQLPVHDRSSRCSITLLSNGDTELVSLLIRFRSCELCHCPSQLLIRNVTGWNPSADSAGIKRGRVKMCIRHTRRSHGKLMAHKALPHKDFLDSDLCFRGGISESSKQHSGFLLERRTASSKTYRDCDKTCLNGHITTAIFAARMAESFLSRSR